MAELFECPLGEFGCDYKSDKKKLAKHIKSEPLKHLAHLCDGVRDIYRSVEQLNTIHDRKMITVDMLSPSVDRMEKIYGVHMLWVIDSYQMHFNQAKNGSVVTMFSPAFLTSRHGYKLAASTCLYGDGKHRGKAMSVFLCICKGDFDQLQIWPFCHSVTFTLLDQADKPAEKKHISHVVKANPVKGISEDQNAAFLSRPTHERNASFGAQKFVELAMLQRFDYIKDDRLYIKIQVDMKAMPSI